MINKKHILITAGPTRERIDPVRFISNRSSGKMGYALAKAAYNMNWEVTLISGPVNLPPPEGVTLINIESAEEMACEVRKLAKFADIIIMAAAVADYRPVKTESSKIKKGKGNLILELERTTDILAELRSSQSQIELKKDLTLVGFAAETENLINNAQDKLNRKKLDWIIANDVSRTDTGFQSDNNEVTMLSKHGDKIKLPRQSKEKIAEIILKTISD